MSGRRIDDHSAWMGSRGKKSVLPEGPYKVKDESQVEGAGHVGTEYPDTAEDIRSGQEAGARAAKGRPARTGYRY